MTSTGLRREEINPETIRAAMLAEYAALRGELLDRIRGQARSAGGAIALIGGFIGVMAAVKLNSGQSLIYTLIHDQSIEAITVFGFLCSGFVLAMELLIAFWAYQLFMLFRIHRYLKTLSGRYRDFFDKDDAYFLLGWDRWVAGGKDVDLTGQGKTVKAAVRAISYAQPLALFVVSTLGLIGIGWGAVLGEVVLTSLCALLFIGLLAVGLILVSLHIWVKGSGAKECSVSVKSKETSQVTQDEDHPE